MLEENIIQISRVWSCSFIKSLYGFQATEIFFEKVSKNSVYKIVDSVQRLYRKQLFVTIPNLSFKNKMYRTFLE